MNSKLTLKLNKAVIEEAKKYAKEKGVSLSNIIENYLALLTNKKQSAEIEITPLVKRLSGIAKIDEEIDEKDIYREYLLKKYK